MDVKVEPLRRPDLARYFFYHAAREKILLRSHVMEKKIC